MINNLGKFAHPAKNGGRNINTGRRAVGANPAPGSGITPPNRSGQREPAGNKVITGGKTEMSPRNPMTSPANQSLQAQSQISAPPAPFKTSGGIVNQSVGKPPIGAIPGPVQKPYSGLKKTTAPKNPPAGPVGGMKPKTLGLTVGVGSSRRKVGKMTASATKGGHSLLYGD